MDGEILDDKYKIVRLIGQGGMGSVYEAEQISAGRRVAVKVISGDLGKRGGDLVSRFQREAKAASAIDTEHIARVLDAGTDPRTHAPYLVMEYLEGEDLQHLIDRTGPLPPRVALKIVAQACVGLDKAHAARVVHRDIKPANLFLARTAGGEVIVKLLDFGIAKIKGDPVRGLKTSDLTDSGSILGSPLFMSPEQVQDIKTLDYRTDLWSLGVVLYCALSGRAPHEDIKNFAKLIMALCEGSPPSIQEAAPWVSAEVAAVVHGALQKDPASRFPTAKAMLEAIEPLLPGGFALDEEMLVPLEVEARSVVAPRLDRTTAAISSDRDGTQVSGTETTEEIVVKRVVAVDDSAPGIRGTETTEQVVVAKAKKSGRTPTGPASQPDTLRPRTRSRVPVLIGAGIVVALGALGFSWVLASARVHSQAPVRKYADLPAPPSEAPAPSALPALPAIPPPRKELRRVKVAVSPSDVSVEVGGEAAVVRDGAVEIEGELGSLHEVRIFKGKDEHTCQVVVTEAGALPASLELKVTTPEVRGSAGKKGATAAGAVTAAGTAAAAVTAAPPKPTATSGEPLLNNNKFE